MSASSFEIITKKEDWRNVLARVSEYDFYHTYDYHDLAKLDDEEPILIKYEENNTIIALPFLLRKIYDTGLFDLTSVYGYAGPVTKNLESGFLNHIFQEKLKNFFAKNNIISLFARLNPFVSSQEVAIKGLGEVVQLSKVVNIDLTQSIEDQKTVFSKTTKRYIKKTRKLCSIKVGGSPEDIDTFIDLYYENMDRVNAKESYYFDKAYFEKFISSADFTTDVMFVIHNETNKIISAAIMVKTNNIIQYHISGTRNDYLNLTPIRILIDEMRILGTEQGYKYFNLGGGLGSSEDSLFNFKASFSKNYKDFKIWRYIINEEKYNELVSQYCSSNQKGDFFPLYRDN